MGKRLKTNSKNVDKIIELHLQGLSSRNICEKLDWPKSKKSTVNNILAKWRTGEVKYSKSEVSLKSHLPKVLVFDLETSPLKSYTWGLWQQNVGLNMIESEWFLLSYAAKWLGDDPENTFYGDLRGIVNKEDDTHLLEEMWKLLDEADIVVTQNGKKFDVKKINARFILNGFQPPSDYKHIDTLQIAKANFGFTSNKLEWMTDKLNVHFKKLDHGNFAGFNLWKGMLEDNIEAWKECEEYNKYDVLSLEELYYKLAPWDKKHPNFNLYTENEEHVCRCGSRSIVEYGFAYTGVSKFQRYRCTECGATTRGRKNLFNKGKRGGLHMNIS